MHCLTITQVLELADVSQGLARAGRGAEAREGGWMPRAPEAGDIEGGRLDADSLKEMGFIQNQHTEENLLRPFAVFVTVRSGRTGAALVPTHMSRTVASITLPVMRPKRPESAQGHWL